MARVKVLLMQDVAHLGHAGEAYLVAGGYARKLLLPRGMAVLATSGDVEPAGAEAIQAGWCSPPCQRDVECTGTG